MICLIQARISSSRFPGKVLKKIGDKELLLHQVLNLRKSRFIKDIFILTSNHKSDEKIIKFCKKNNIKHFKGSLNNTFLRFQKFLKLQKNIKSFLRISGDSPLIDFKLVDKIIKFSKNKNFDIITNIFPRSFPKGQSIEIINYSSFMLVKNSKLNISEKEHVTQYFYNNHKKKIIINYKNKKNYSMYNLSIDTVKDFKKIKKIMKIVNNKPKTLNNLLKAHDKL